MEAQRVGCRWERARHSYSCLQLSDDENATPEPYPNEYTNKRRTCQMLPSDVVMNCFLTGVTNKKQIKRMSF